MGLGKKVEGTSRRFHLGELKGESPWLAGYEHCNENFILVFLGYATIWRPVGCVAPFDAPAPADDLVR